MPPRLCVSWTSYVDKLLTIATGVDTIREPT